MVAPVNGVEPVAIPDPYELLAAAQTSLLAASCSPMVAPQIRECLSFIAAAKAALRKAMDYETSGRCRERAQLLAPGVDGLVVAALVAGQVVVGASRAERAGAAVVLHRGGRSPGWIAARLGVGDQQVRRWLERAQSGRPLNPRSGRSGKGAVA